MTRFLTAVLFAALFTSAARGADVTDPAELFPPGTLAYAEVHDPAAVAPQLAAVFKGTLLEDSIPFIHGRRDAAKELRDLQSKDQLAMLGLFTSPEMTAEFKKLRGIAVGVTGFTAEGESEYALAVLTGDSQAAGLAARAMLTMTTLRKVALVGDVPVYQFRQPTIGYDPNGRQILQNDKVTEGPHETTIAYLPGLIVVGTGKGPVGEVVARFQGKTKGSLAGSPLFKEAAAAHRKPGLFFYSNIADLLKRYDESRKTGPDSLQPDAMGWFQLLVNDKAVRYIAGCATFRDGGLALTLGGSFDPAQKSPLLDFLAGPGTKVEVLRHAPAPATVAFAVTLPTKDRGAAVVRFLDAIAKSNGELGRLPSDAVKELEAKHKVPLAEGLIGKTQTITLVMPVRQDLPKGARPLPMFVLHTEGPEVAAAWEEFLPKLIGDLAKGAPPQPTTEVIAGVKVFSLPGAGLPSKAAVHYARKDSVLVVGLDRKLVAVAANGDAAGSVAGTNAISLPAGEPPVLVGTLGLGGVVRLATEKTVPEGPVVPLGPVKPATPQPGARGFSDELDLGSVPGPVGPATPNQQKDEAKAWDDVLRALDGLPPTTVTARRTANELRIELWQPKVQGGGLAPVVNTGVGLFEKLFIRTGNPNGYPSPRFGRFREG